MKILSLFFLSLMFSGTVFSQDTIVLRDNRKILAKISEISPSRITYKRFDLPEDGPVFTEDIQRVHSIRYKNGIVDEFNDSPVVNAPVKEEQKEEHYDFVQIDKKSYLYNGRPAGVNKINKVLSQKKDSELNAALLKMNKAKRRQYLGFGAAPAAGVAFYGLIYGSILDGYERRDKVISNVFYGASVVGAVAIVGFTATGIIFSGKYKKRKAEAVKLYNEKF